MYFWVTVKKNQMKKGIKKIAKYKIRKPHSSCNWERERETCKSGSWLIQHLRLLDILPKLIDPCLELFEVTAAITWFENIASREVHSPCIVSLLGRSFVTGVGLLQTSKNLSMIWLTNFISIASKWGNKILVESHLSG